jgi:hypothetical protein
MDNQVDDRHRPPADGMNDQPPARVPEVDIRENIDRTLRVAMRDFGTTIFRRVLREYKYEHIGQVSTMDMVTVLIERMGLEKASADSRPQLDKPKFGGKNR